MPAGRRLKCKMCGESFTDKAEWSKHLHVTHAQSSLVDDSLSEEDEEEEDDEEMDDEPAQKRPRRRILTKPKPEIDEPSFGCPECGMVFNTKRGLAAHNMHRHRSSSTPKSSNLTSTASRNQSPNTVSETSSARPTRKSSVTIMEPPPKATSQTPTATASAAIIANIAGLEQESEEPEEYEYVPEAVEEEPEPEVENYPCKYCKDRIFLTSFGLERHTKLSHPENMEEALKEIKRIQAEKAKKAEARKLIEESAADSHSPSPSLPSYRRRSMAASGADPDYAEPIRAPYAAAARYKRERYSAPAAHSMRRRYSTKVTVEKENEPNFPDSTESNGEVIQMVRQQRSAMVASASFTEPRPTGRHKRSLDAPKAKYQSCEICGILINTEHPKAMESHTKAHQKNQELRQELLRLYGPSWVDNVTCRECNLVFKDEEKLDQHRRNVHVRRRHFLCRFCGDVFRNMRDLNMHKERRHEAFEGHRRNLENNGNGPDFIQSPQVFRRPMPPPGPNRNANNFPASYENGAAPPDGNVEEFSCRTVCEVCGLQMVRPSNLIRHMKQAHNKTNFTAIVETRGMPPFKIDVFEGQFMWGCCDDVYDDRQAFINHRRLAHGPSYVGNPKECEHCGLSFKNNVSYINHLRTHRPRVCHICGESFGNTATDLSSYRVHMLKHRDQGYNIRFSQIEDELNQKENQDLWRAIEEEEADDESEDDYSIFSESGVESDGDENSDLDEEDDGTLLTSCTMCDKKFACMYRFADHWSLHCKRASLVDGINFKTKPFRFNEGKLSWSCTNCHKRFKGRATLALHYLNCAKKRYGEIPKENEVLLSSSIKSKLVGQTLTKSPAMSPTQTPLKSIPSLLTEGSNNDNETEKTSDHLANVSRELEDSLDVGAAKERQSGLPMYVEKAYVVEWDTNKVPPEHPYLCRTCDQPFGDFLSLIMHVKTHVTHPICDEIEAISTDLTSKANGNGDSVARNAGGIPDANAESATEKGDGTNETVNACVIRIRTSGTAAPGKHACSICSRRFGDKDTLEEHVHLNHSMRKEYYCRLCGEKFWTVDGLNNHSKRHDVNNFYCNVCDKKFVSLETLNKHETVHELTNSLYQCEDCSQSFFGLHQLQRHFKEHHQGVVILTCPICARIHTDAETLRIHFETEHADSRSRCLICDKIFETPMQAHCHAKRIHMLHGTTANCTLCDKIFTEKHQLALHMWRHTTNKGFQCRVCDAAFDTDEGVREHLEKIHNINWVDSRDLIIDNQTVFNEEKENGGLKSAKKCFSCYVCSRRFESKAAVKAHVARVHYRKKKHACSLCGVKFSRANHLKDHMAFRHNVIDEEAKEANFAENLEQGHPVEQADGFMEGGEEQPHQEQTANYEQNVDEQEPQSEQFLFNFGINEQEPMQL